MKIDNNRIKKFKIFNGVDDEGIKLFLDKLQLKSHKKNDIIMQEGDEGHSILFLLSASDPFLSFLDIGVFGNKAIIGIFLFIALSTNFSILSNEYL